MYFFDMIKEKIIEVKAGVSMKAVFWLGVTFLTQISR